MHENQDICHHCKDQFHIEDLDGKPWHLRGPGSVLVRLFPSIRLRALRKAAEAGDEFGILECPHCYGPGWEKGVCPDITPAPARDLSCENLGGRPGRACKPHEFRIGTVVSKEPKGGNMKEEPLLGHITGFDRSIYGEAVIVVKWCDGTERAVHPGNLMIEPDKWPSAWSDEEALKHMRAKEPAKEKHHAV